MDIRNFFQDYLLVILFVNIHYGLCMHDEDYDEAPAFGRCPWIRNKLKNGRVRYRYKGRVAKFLCDSGYELAGKRSSTCVRGQWSNPVPVCVARGCSRVPSIANGRITEMYRGALLMYDCNPGYTLAGDVSIHCDGRRWNSSPPVCGVSTPDPETQCDFESPDLCGWTHDPTHDFDWKRNQFATPSGHVGTGPSHDHTFGKDKAGYYLYIEASSPRQINDTARLFSPVYPADQSGGCFIFWYHMYGATTGGIRIYLKPESHVFGELSPNWQKFGDQGNQWFRGNIAIPVLYENFQIVIEAVRGESYVGDSAIDDVQLSKLDCESMTNVTEEENTFPESCRGRCQESDSSSSCGCNENCFAAENCCSDYLTLCPEGNETIAQNVDEPLPGDYYGKSTSPVTAIITVTSLKPTEEQTLTSFTNLSSQSTSLASTAAPIVTSAPVTNSTTTVPTGLLPSTTTAVIPSTKMSTSTTPKHTTQSSTTHAKTETHSSTTQAKTEPLSSTTSIVTTETVFTKSDTTVSNTVPKTTKEKATSATETTDALKISSSAKSTVMTTTSSTATPQTTSTQKTSKLPPTTTSTSTTTTTTTPKPTSTTTTTTTPKPTSTTTTSTTPMPRSTTTATTTPMTTSTSTITSTESITVLNSVSILVNPSESISGLPSTESTSTSSAIPSTTTPRYNLRPRKTTPTVSTESYTNATTLKYSSSVTTRTTVGKEDVSSFPPAINSTPQRIWLNLTVFSTSSTSTVGRTTKQATNAPPKTSSTTRNQPVPTKFTFFTSKSTPYKLTSTVRSTADSYEMITSKAESPESSSRSVIVVVLVVIVIICVAGGVAFYLRKYRNKRQTKLDDDSEMRFLPESDYMEYSDASALERILVK